MKNSTEIVRASLVPFFNACADDLIQTVNNIRNECYSHLNGTLTRGNCSLLYLYLVSIPVLAAMLDHIGRNDYGKDLFVQEIAIAGFKILNAAWTLGTNAEQIVRRQWIKEEMERHRPLLGECLSSFACCFPVAFFEPEFFDKNEVSSDLSSLSPESHEVMQQVNRNIPSLPAILHEVQHFAQSAAHYSQAPHIFDVVVPTLSSYIAYWYRPESASPKTLSAVNVEDAELLLSSVVQLIGYNVDSDNSPWMKRIALDTLPIISITGTSLLEDDFCFVAGLLRRKCEQTIKNEVKSKHTRITDATKREQMEFTLLIEFDDLIRVIYAFFPIMMKYVDLHRTTWLKTDDLGAEYLYSCVADIFNLWGTSKLFKRQEINYVTQNEIDCTTMLVQKLVNQLVPFSRGARYNPKQRKIKKRLVREKFNSLVVACIKRILPIGLNMYSGVEQELIQLAKEKMVQISEGENVEVVGVEDAPVLSLKSDHEEQVIQYIRSLIQSQLKSDETDLHLTWQSVLYRRIKTKRGSPDLSNVELVISRIMKMAKVLYGLHLVDHPPQGKKGVWRKLISSQRKKAVVACFRVAPLHSIPRHRAINLFVTAYRDYWLNSSDVESSATLVERLTSAVDEFSASTMRDGSSSTAVTLYDPLTQFIRCLNRAATTEDRTIVLDTDRLYLDYATLMSQSIHFREEDDDDDKDALTEVKSIEEQEMEKQKLLMEQTRLSQRGVAETVTHYISACNGENNEMLQRTLCLGISLLHGGNKAVQRGMLQHLKDTRDSGFFSSIATLMTNCSVLDLDIFERTLKAESLGTYNKGSISDGNLSDEKFICNLFRFLQLLCEGHYLDFQNFLRAQVGNSTSVNIIICSVDYLLSLQESMMEFYWHFSGKDSMEATGKECFCRAITVARQVFNTLTEYIQGPCVQNQLALAHSRLWDAVSGFIFMFANLQNKLSKDPKQIELMRELMKLQKDMIIMLLSMLEGNVLHGAIGKQMVDTLIETQPNVEMLLQFFDIFLKMKGLTTSEAFLEFDTNKDGFISPKEFKRAMENQKMYTEDEIEYILMCVDANQDGKIDFIEFTERFHNPAKDIGFNMAVLLTNLSEHMPHDIRLHNLMEKARSFLSYFEKSLGRIEIMGASHRIERVYFEIKESNREQWNKPQIKDSKKQFLNSIVNETDDKEKLENFVNFCEDTIFEMQHAAAIGGEDRDTVSLSSVIRAKSAEVHGRTINSVLKSSFHSVSMILRPGNIVRFFKQLRQSSVKQLARGIASFMCGTVRSVVLYGVYVLRIFVYFLWQLMLEDTDQEVVDYQHAERIKRHLERHSAVPDTSFIPHGEGISTFSAFGLEIRASPENDLVSGTSAITAATEGFSAAQRGVRNGRKISALLEKIRTTSPFLTYEIESTGPSAGDNFITKDKTDPARTGHRSKRLKSFLALNFYKLKYLALILAFIINFFVLSYRVVPLASGDGRSGKVSVTERIVIDPDRYYINYILGVLAFVHSFVSFCMLIAYYLLKVPLVIFRREKEISRKLEFDGMWIVEQPAENDLKNNWDKLVLSTASFPSSFWNKFVKKKVKSKYIDQFDGDDLNKLLGLEKTGSSTLSNFGLLGMFQSVDWKYNVWKWGVILTDRSFIYLLWYFAFSVLGNYNYFFFAGHLIDIAVSIKALSTIIVSITQNGRQLLLTITLMAVVVYIYSVIAFNFFRKFYKTEDDGQTQEICTNMFSCFVFHVYHGVRSGGGIGDELESPSGDALEFYRIIFDMTFFFFVVIILLAILQGLIIDAFGELREQLESVKETLESKCFICGIGQDYFNKEPHGFEIHTTKEHDFANYMFFLMHLINKPDTEHTGQESYVWEQYQNRKWDFFPVGDCFRKHYENTAEPT